MYVASKVFDAILGLAINLINDLFSFLYRRLILKIVVQI
jgi:hypothetical protein